VQHLERNAVAGWVLGEEDPCGTAPADLAMEAIAVAEGLLNDRKEVAADGSVPAWDMAIVAARAVGRKLRVVSGRPAPTLCTV
jgi:hypothetical protein